MKKDQFIIAYLPSEDVCDTVLSYSLFLARMLKKDIILLHIDDKRYHERLDEDYFKSLQEKVRQENPDGPHASYCILHERSRKALSAVATLLNGVVVVAAVNPHARHRTPSHRRELLRNFAECKIAYLTVRNGRLATHHTATKVAFSVDYRKESKEKLIWASYFARFNHSQLQLFHERYTDERLHRKWHNNMLFLDKFFNSMVIPYTKHTLPSRHVLFPETVVANAASAEGCDLLISTTTDLRDRDIVEYFAGTAEQRVILNEEQLPVLFLNPRDDLYVLCD